MSGLNKTFAGIALAICVVAGAMVVQSPTGLEKAGKPDVVPASPDRISISFAGTEEDVIERLVHAPVKLRGLRGLSTAEQVELKELMRRTEDLIRTAARDGSGLEGLDAEEQDSLERAVLQYRAELERFSP